MFTSINTLLGSLASTKKDRPCKRHGQFRRQRRLLFEPLEDRRVLSSVNFGLALAAGGTGDDYGEAIATDADGNVFTTGHFRGTADFDPGPGSFHLTSSGGYDIFVAKYTGAGALVWARGMGGTSDDFGYEIAVDGAGNVYTTGGFYGTVDFDPGPGSFHLTSNGGSEDIFVSKLTQLSADRTRIGIQVVAVAMPSTSGSTVLPSGLETVPLGSRYYVEVWVQDQSVPGVGVSGGWVDVNYTTAVPDAVEVFNLDFDVEGLEGGEIDEAGGVVRDLGGGVRPGHLRLDTRLVAVCALRPRKRFLGSGGSGNTGCGGPDRWDADRYDGR